LAGGLALVTACDDADRASSAERGTPIQRGQGKADGTNSCAGYCGGMAPAGCYCDDTCDDWGDCCPDKAEVCDGTPASCEGHCGGQSPAGCYCDDACENWGDCCQDKQQVCGAGEEGCTGNDACDDGQVCNIESCDSGATGSCVERPDACAAILAPVCGCDEQTYDNDCRRLLAGVAKKSDGECQTPCYIGGCSGEVCSPFEGVNTPCVALPWHACVDLSECGLFAPGGGCGWKQTPEYVACMQQHGETP
jgi:hypothetical protein